MLSTGALYTAGSGQHGQLGLGRAQDSADVARRVDKFILNDACSGNARVVGGDEVHVSHVACGMRHTLAVVQVKEHGQRL